MRKQLMSMFMLLGLLGGFGAMKAQAQVAEPIEADIPFYFHAGNAKFEPGKYTVRMRDDSELMLMEITSADTHHSALFQVRDAEATADPVKAELVFNRYGDQYFLAKIFDEGNKTGSEVLESHYERLLKKGETKPEQRHIPGHRHMHPKAD
ncbi:MAG: hypothetical protein HYR56_20745 [Acidobacteria bacterium]|nr:hypothetical protein [Acidobacteriota bacterium]MBI3425912.1 hypothetical protein [Acidobacteriota bacterium]